jgi:glycosyltransferase involved in cell wall biosynthesis
MRIAFVAPFGLRAKGTTRARALPLAAELARRGHTVALFIPPYDSPEDAGKRWQEAAGVDVINVELPEFGLDTAAWHLWLGWRLFRAVQAWQPEVVHIFKPKGPSGLVGTLVWATRGRGDTGTRREVLDGHRVSVSPYPRVIIDSDDWEGAGGWNDDPRAGYSPLQCRFFAWQERYGLSHADAWTVTSECLRQRAVGFGADSERVLVLHNGIMTHAARSTQHAAEARSAMSEAAGPSVRSLRSAILYTRFAGVRAAGVASIWEKVRRRAPDAMLTVVGRGLGGEERELAGVPGIDVQGWVEPAEMPALFARMTVALAPWTDMPSNRARHSAKVLELMAAGLPIVAYAVGELPATLGDAGVLVPPGEAAAFAAAVVSLMADPGRAATLGAAAQARTRAEFTWERLANVAIAAYRAAGAEVGQLADSSRVIS